MPVFTVPNSCGAAPLVEENPCHEPGGSSKGGRFARKDVCGITPSTKVHKQPKGKNVTTLENFADAETVKLVFGANVDVAEVAKGMVADVEWDQPFGITIKSHGGPYDDRMPGYFVHNIQGNYVLRRNLEYRFRNEASAAEQAETQAFQRWVRGTPEFQEWAKANYVSFGMASPSVTVSLATPGDEVTAMRVFRRRTYRDVDGSEASTLSVDHHYFEVSDAAPLGLGKQLLRGSIEEYERLGVSRISTHANIDVGGYAWGRYGFAPVDALEVYPGIRDKVRDLKQALTDFEENPEILYAEKVWDPVTKTRRSQLVRANVTPKTIAALTKLVERLGGPAQHNDPAKEPFWALIDAHIPGRVARTELDAGTPAKFSIGKWLMLETDWEGRFNMKDPAQMRRMRRYLYGNA